MTIATKEFIKQVENFCSELDARYGREEFTLRDFNDARECYAKTTKSPSGIEWKEYSAPCLSTLRKYGIITVTRTEEIPTGDESCKYHIVDGNTKEVLVKLNDNNEAKEVAKAFKALGHKKIKVVCEKVAVTFGKRNYYTIDLEALKIYRRVQITAKNALLERLWFELQELQFKVDCLTGEIDDLQMGR